MDDCLCCLKLQGVPLAAVLRRELQPQRRQHHGHGMGQRLQPAPAGMRLRGQFERQGVHEIGR